MYRPLGSRRQGGGTLPRRTRHRLESTTFTPFARLALAYAIGVCGDVFVTVSLADSLFFSATTSGSARQGPAVPVLTLAPFAVVAPVLGPLLDRTRGGRRLLFAGVGGRPGGAVPAHGGRDRRARCSIRSRSRARALEGAVRRQERARARRRRQPGRARARELAARADRVLGGTVAAPIAAAILKTRRGVGAAHAVQ